MQDVQPAVVLYRRVNHPSHIVRSCDVRDAYRTLAAFLLDRALQFLRPLRGSVYEDDLGTFAREEGGYCTPIADAGAARCCAGHNCDFAF